MPRKRIKQKSAAKNQNSQNVYTTRKRKRSAKTRNTEQSHIQHKRRRSKRYNLRLQKTDSVVLVDESPCSQTPEQLEKYTKLGLNSALFIKGSQPPKRIQSHISIITVSSDEEISEERTNDWINSLSETYQNIEEIEPSNVTENHGDFVSITHLCNLHPSGCTCSLDNTVKQEQNFQIDLDTPNTSSNSVSPMKHHSVDSNKSVVYGFNKLDSTEYSMEHKHEMFSESRSDNQNFHQDHLPRSNSDPVSSYLFPEQSINLKSSDLKQVEEHPIEKHHFTFSSSATFKPAEQQLAKEPYFIFGSKTGTNLEPVEEDVAKKLLFTFGLSTSNTNVNRATVSPLFGGFRVHSKSSYEGQEVIHPLSSTSENILTPFNICTNNSLFNPSLVSVSKTIIGEQGICETNELNEDNNSSLKMRHTKSIFTNNLTESKSKNSGDPGNKFQEGDF